MLSFAQPFWILIGAFFSLILWFLWTLQDTRRRKQLETFVASSLLKDLTANVSNGRRLIKKILILGAVFCFFLALARPQLGYHWIDVKHKGIDILFAIDTSRSMLAEDIKPNRLDRSKFAIIDFVSELTGDRVGLLPFAGSSYLMSPLTADYYAFEQSLMAVDTTIIPVGGTNIGNALASAENVLSNEANHKILILITDGENLEGDALKAALDAQKKGMTVYTVGVGTAEGELIPDRLAGGFIRDKEGSFVKSRLDEKNLTAIAEATGGFYVPLGAQGEGLATIYQEKLALIPKEELAEKRKKIPIDRFQWPLALAIVLMSIEYLLSGRKSRRTLPKKIPTTIGLSMGLLALSFLNPLPGQTSEAEEAYDSGDYLTASEHYQLLLEEDPDNPKLLYNNGTIAYKNNLFDEAVESFEKALNTDDLELQEKAYFNKGNALFRKGEETSQADPQSTIKIWERSLESFDNGLSLDPDDENARFNYDYVKKQLEQLKKQQEEQSEQQNEQNQDSKDQQDKDENSDQSDSKDNKDGQDQSDSKENEGEQDQSDSKENEGKQDQSESKENEGNQDQSNSDKAGNNQPDSGNEQKEDKQAEPEKNIENLDELDQATSGQETDKDPDSGKELSAGSPRKMTQEEAEKLLQAIQGEEGRLNLYSSENSDINKNPQKDW